MFFLYRKLLAASIRAQMQYKLNFTATAVTTAILSSIDFLILSAILHRFDHVKGWNLYEVGILYGLASIAVSLYRMLAPEIHDFERYIVFGELDQLLTRPVSPLLLLLTRNLELSRIGGVVQGLFILIVSLGGLAGQGRVTWLLLAYLPIALLTGLMIFFAIGLATATTAFWTGQLKELQTFTIFAPATAANFPISLYPGWLKLLFYSVVPVAFLNYVPMLFLLDKGGAWPLLLVAPLVGGVFCWLSIRFWQFGIRHYHSTGS
jgi:ABC-2 type transport system permease protein